MTSRSRVSIAPTSNQADKQDEGQVEGERCLCEMEFFERTRCVKSEKGGEEAERENQ